MANDIIIKFRVQKDGTLKAVQSEAEAASKSTKKLGKSTDDLTNSRNRYHKAEKGAAGLGANSTKNFSKMNQAMTGSSGLVAAYATLAANAFALSAAFGALRQAAAFDQLVSGLQEIGSAAGQNLPYLADQLRDITDNAISAEQALRATAVASSSGFSPDQLAKLTKVAKGASTALGRDMGDALDRLVRGTAKLEPEILDELGIIVRLDDATSEYAASMGKTASQLTTFERQQAFLNATIEQGTKKFGEIADNVDVNAFDQLAATFSDLTKNTLSLVNDGLGPLINFLSQNQFALAGALTLFVSSIGKALIPTIKDVATENNKAARASMKAYKRAGTAISAEYTKISKSVKKVNVDVGSLPKTAQTMLPAFKKGTLSVKELETMVLRLKQSEKLRNVALSRYSGEELARKQKEISDVILLRTETEKLIAAEKSRNVVSSRGAKAKGVGTANRITSMYLTSMEGTDNPLKKLGIAAKGTMTQLQNVGRTYTKTASTIGKGAAVVNAGRVAFTAAAGAVRLFGTALLSAIPFVGQAILLFSLFQQPIMNFINKMRGIDPELEKIKESFDSFAQINNKLAKSLEHSESAFDSFAAKISAKTGVINQLESALQGVLDKEEERRNAQVNDNIDAIITKENQLKALREKMATSQSANIGYKGRENNQKILNLEEEISDLRAQNAQLQTDPATIEGTTEYGTRALEVARSFQSKLLDADGILSKAFSEDDRIKIQEVIDTLEGGGSIEKAQEQLRQYSDTYDKLDASINAIPTTIADVEAEQAKLVQTAKGPLGLLIDRYDSLSAEVLSIVDNTKKSGGDLQAVFDELNRNKSLAKMASKLGSTLGLENIEKLAKRAGINLEKGLNASAPELLSARLKEINEELKTVGDRSKEAAEKAKEIGTIAKENAAATALQISYEMESISIKQRGLDLEEENAKLNLEGVPLQEKLAEIEGKRSLLKQQMIKPEEITFRIQSAKIAGEQKLLGFENRRLSALKSMADIENRMAKSRLALERAKTGSAVTAEDEVALLKKEQERLAPIEKQQLDATLKRIDLEFQLLSAQMTLEKAKIDRLAKELGLSQQEVAVLKTPLEQVELSIAGDGDEKGLKQLTKDAAIAQANSVTEQRALNILLAEERAKREAIATAHERAMTAANILREAGREAAALGAEEAALRAQLTTLKEEQAGIEKGSQAYANKALEIEQKKLEIIQNQKAQSEEMVKRLETLGLGGIAQFAAGLQQATQEGGAFAEGSDATTAEKVQALRNMTSGLMEDLKKLGPEGEVLAAVSSGALAITETWSTAFDTLKTEGVTTAEKIQAAMQAVGATLQAIGAIQQAQANAAVSEIDKQIEAEKRRDGKSKESVNKIAGLEKKKEQVQRKAFEKDKKIKMAMVVANTAASIAANMVAASTAAMQAGLAAPGVFAGYLGLLNGITLAMGAAQLASIASTSFQGGGGIGGGGAAPSSVSVGSRQNTVDLGRATSPAGELAYARGEAGIGTGMTNFKPTPAFTGTKYRANGGNTAFMVGEQGPELFVPDRQGSIVPSDEVPNVGNNINVNFSINAVDGPSVENMLLGQRGNIIGMIREAANETGETFLESVNVLSDQYQPER